MFLSEKLLSVTGTAFAIETKLIKNTLKKNKNKQNKRGVRTQGDHKSIYGEINRPTDIKKI